MITKKQICSIDNQELVHCKECASLLKLMHTSISQQASGSALVVNKLFHCETCLRDWESEEVYILQHQHMERKFWG